MNAKSIFLTICIVFYNITLSQTIPQFQWEKTFGTASNDYSNSVVQTSDNGFVFAGNVTPLQIPGTVNSNYSDILIVKTNQLGNIIWQKTYGGSNVDTPTEIQKTSDGGFIVVGYTRSNNGHVTINKGDYDYWILKLDANGDLQWQKTYGGPDSDQASSVKQTLDGGYIIVGQSFSSSGDITNPLGNSDFWIIKTNDVGNIQWQKSFGGTSTDGATSVVTNTDGSYTITGTSISPTLIPTLGGIDNLTIKISSTGNIIWEKRYGSPNYDDSRCIYKTADNGYIIAGAKDVNNATKFWILKIDALGNIQWENTFGNSSALNYGKSVIQLSDGTYLATGSINDTTLSNYHGGGTDIGLVKLDQMGNILTYKCLGGSLNEDAHSIINTNDGGFAIIGETKSSNGDVSVNNGLLDIWLLKFGNQKEELSTNETFKNKLKIYPNPANHFVTIDNLETKSTITIYDMSGKLIFNKKFTEKKALINVAEFSKGVYNLVIKNKEISFSEKLIVN